MALPREFLGTLFHPDDTSYPPDMSPALQDASKENNFDFIVIGLGAAGAAVAARFAHDNPQWSVLALESGTDPPIEAEVPGLWFRLWRDELLWMYPSEPRDDAFQGMQGKRTTMIRGKAIGGTSTVNGMPYLRGHPKDYDSWQIEGWSFKDVLPFFKRFEDMRDSRVLDLNPDYHGVGGEMTVEPAKSTDPLKSVIKAAAKELGYDEVIDMNGPGDLGFGDIHRTQRDGTRCGSAKAYLSKAAPGGGQLTNLTIGKCCTATKLVFDADQKRVTAVEFQAPLGGAPSMAYVTKEVILCAGAMETPKLLMLSGVGPKDHLQDLGIPVIEDLPVGETLQDHALFPGIIFTVPPVPAVSSDPLKAFVEEKSGPLSNVGLMELMGFIKTESTADWEVPSVQFNHVRYPKGCFQSMALAPEIEEAIKKINHDSDILVIMPFLLHPQKPGKLCLRSADAKDPPKFISGLLADPRDVEVMREGIAFVEKMAKTKSFQEAGIIMRYVEFPGSESMIPGSSSYWEHALRLLAGSAFHPVATCALGIVLDSQLRVKGVQNVRVADASAIPSPLSANPNAPAIMIGERAAQFLLEEYKDHPPVND